MSGPLLIVDDDAAVRDSLRALLESSGFVVRDFDSAKAVLADTALAQGGCLIADIRMPDMDGLTLQEQLIKRQIAIPVIIVTGHGDVPLAVRAMRAGAVDFVEKPFDEERLLKSIARALAMGKETPGEASLIQAKDCIGMLTELERRVLEQLIAGRSNKAIAHELQISPQAVEVHRAHVMEKVQARSLSDLVRLALVAGPVSPARR